MAAGRPELVQLSAARSGCIPFVGSRHRHGRTGQIARVDKTVRSGRWCNVGGRATFVAVVLVIVAAVAPAARVDASDVYRRWVSPKTATCATTATGVRGHDQQHGRRVQQLAARRAVPVSVGDQWRHEHQRAVPGGTADRHEGVGWRRSGVPQLPVYAPLANRHHRRQSDRVPQHARSVMCGGRREERHGGERGGAPGDALPALGEPDDGDVHDDGGGRRGDDQRPSRRVQQLAARRAVHGQRGEERRHDHQWAVPGGTAVRHHHIREPDSDVPPPATRSRTCSGSTPSSAARSCIAARSICHVQRMARGTSRRSTGTRRHRRERSTAAG